MVDITESTQSHRVFLRQFMTKSDSSMVTDKCQLQVSDYSIDLKFKTIFKLIKYRSS